MSGIAGWLGPPIDESSQSRLESTLANRATGLITRFNGASFTLMQIGDRAAAERPNATESRQQDRITAVADAFITDGPGTGQSAESSRIALARAYESYGVSLFERLRGPFAIAIFDHDNQSLVLARDRFAAKPLFYAPMPGRLAFASDIQTLLQTPEVDTTPDRQAIYDMAALLYMPIPMTLFAGIRALGPGEALTASIEDGRLKYYVQPFFTWSIHVPSKLSLDEALDRSDALFQQAMRNHQTTNGTSASAYLSGGIDSSLISAGIQKATGRQLKTFNMQFNSREYDETWAATAVAEHIGSDHTTVNIMDHPGSWEAISGLLTDAGQPISDIAFFPNHILAREMAKESDIIFSGSGADCAYGHGNILQRLAAVGWIQAIPKQAQGGVWRAASALARSSAAIGLTNKKVATRIEDMSRVRDLAGAAEVLLRKVQSRELDQLIRPFDALPVARYFEPRWEHNLPERTSWTQRLASAVIDARVRIDLPSATLFMEDATAAINGVEMRLPFLDEDFFAAGISLPYPLQTTAKTNKVVLRALARRYLPDAIAHKPKMGFTFRMDQWVSSDFHDGLRDTILQKNNLLDEYFRPEAYRPIVEAFIARRPYPGIQGNGLARRVLMLLSIYLQLNRR